MARTKSEDPYTGVKLSARSVTNWPRPRARRTRRIFSDDHAGRAALVVDPTLTANANDTPAVNPTPTARRSSGHVAGLQKNDGSYGSQRTRTRGAKISARSVTNWSRLPTAGFLAKAFPEEPRRPSGARRSSGHVAGLQEQRWLVRRPEGPYSGGETLSSIGNELVETPHRGMFSEDSVGRAVAPYRGRGEAAATWPG